MPSNNAYIVYLRAFLRVLNLLYLRVNVENTQELMTKERPFLCGHSSTASPGPAIGPVTYCSGASTLATELTLRRLHNAILE